MKIQGGLCTLCVYQIELKTVQRDIEELLRSNRMVPKEALTTRICI